MPRVSVIMPTHRQAPFLALAVGSLMSQSVADWELIVVDDGSPDNVPAALAPFGADSRVRYRRFGKNQGLGAALNAGLDLARGQFVAYLPSDDLYHRDHLEALLAAIGDGVVLAYSGMRHHDTATSVGAPEGHSLQLVQVMHRASTDRWLTRHQLESDDLELLFFAALCGASQRAGTGKVTCIWTDHPGQRHKAIRERDDGGLNVFRRRYRISHPLRLHSQDSGLIDEVALYQRFRDLVLPPSGDGMTVLLVGELAYNPERVLALAERGIRLHGLWTPDGLGYNTVGPMPFGHVTDISDDDWPSAVRALDPDVIYAQLDWRAVPFAARVLDAIPEIPFVWHFKESPQRSIARGEWPLLARLCRDADALLLSSPEERDWFHWALPGQLDPDTTAVLDGSLPKADWFTGRPSAPLAERDGEAHTLVLGRPLGLDADFVGTLAAHGVHLHCHGLRDGLGANGRWERWLSEVRAAAPQHIHPHPKVDQRQWVSVLSRYDAGWMHRFPSHNQGEVCRFTWDDVNHPARLGTLMAAGLPVLQQRGGGSMVAMDRLVEREGIGLRYDDAEDIAARLADRALLDRVRREVRKRRGHFTFDHHVPTLVTLFDRLASRRTRRASKHATATW